MLVRATGTGYCNNHHKNKGDVFIITDKQFSSKWMEKMEESQKVIIHKPKTVAQKIKHHLGGK